MHVEATRGLLGCLLYLDPVLAHQAISPYLFSFSFCVSILLFFQLGNKGKNHLMHNSDGRCRHQATGVRVIVRRRCLPRVEGHRLPPRLKRAKNSTKIIKHQK